MFSSLAPADQEASISSALTPEHLYGSPAYISQAHCSKALPS